MCQEAEQRAIVAGRNVGARRRPPAQRITFRCFDFDDVGATVGQQLGAVRPGDARGEVDNDVPVER